MTPSSSPKYNDSKKKGLPWTHLPSLYSYIQSNLDEQGRLKESGNYLPDEKRLFDGQYSPWIPGAQDGVFGYHGSGAQDEAMAERVARLVQAIARKGLEADKVELYEILFEDNLTDYIGLALEKINGANVPVGPYLHGFARWLAFESPDRGPVKFGIGLLGIIGDKKDADKIIMLGKNDEFTLYAAVAVSNIFEEAEDQLWELAKYAKGWGRIHAVNRLLATQNPEIKRWLLREGFRNEVMYEYLAYKCAVVGDLKGELSKPDPDEEVLEATGELLVALINGGPVADFDDYEDGAEVLRLYINHVGRGTENLTHFLLMNPMRLFLENDEADWEKRKKKGWGEGLRAQLLEDIQKIRSDPKWKRIVLERQHTANPSEFGKVSGAAYLLGIDLWEIHWKWLNENPVESARWYNVMDNLNEERMDQILALATEIIPLDKIATGPAEELGMGEAYRLHHCLDNLVPELGDFPGRGFEFIKAALRSPMIMNRFSAVQALSEWGVKNWPERTKELLEQVTKEEPDEDVREDIVELLGKLSNAN